MTSTQRNQAREILSQCKTLHDAEEALCKINPVLSLALRWGLHDGFRGRPRTLTGFAQEGERVSDDDRLDYNEGCEIGRELSLREVPS